MSLFGVLISLFLIVVRTTITGDVYEEPTVEGDLYQSLIACEEIRTNQSSSHVFSKLCKRIEGSNLYESFGCEHGNGWEYEGFYRLCEDSLCSVCSSVEVGSNCLSVREGSSGFVRIKCPYGRKFYVAIFGFFGVPVIFVLVCSGVFIGMLFVFALFSVFLICGVVVNGVNLICHRIQGGKVGDVDDGNRLGDLLILIWRSLLKVLDEERTVKKKK